MVSQPERATDLPGLVDAGLPPARRFGVLRVCWSSPVNLLGTVLVLAVIVAALFGGVLAPYSPIKPDYGAGLLPPSPQHFFGTDELGRDIFSRVLSGAQVSLEIAVVVVGIGAASGTVIGLISGYKAGWIDEVLMRGTDVFLALPILVVAMAIAATIGPSLGHTILVLALLWWPWYARLIRAQVLGLREREFIEAARAAGVPPWRIMWRHLLPNAMGPLLVQVSLDLGYAILAASSLSFIGLGVQQPQADWGLMTVDATPYMSSAWWAGVFPGLAIVLAVLGFNLLGDTVSEMLDPRRVS